MFNLLYNRFPREMGTPSKFMVNNMEEVCEVLNKRDKNGKSVNNGRRRLFISLYEWNPDEKIISLDKIWFDFDLPQCDGVIKMHKWCMKNNYKHIMFFSGKGFHVYILTKNYSGLNNPKRTLYNCHRFIAEKIGCSVGEGKTFDIDWQTIGDVRRAVTIPGTYNTKRKRYAIGVTRHDLKKGYEYIKENARKQSLGSVVYGTEYFDVSPFNCVMKEFSTPLEYDEGEFIKVNKNEVLLNLPPCLKAWLSMQWPGWKRRGWIIMWLRDKGLWRKQLNETMPAMLEETKSLLKQYLEPQEYKHMIEEDANQPWYLYFKNTSNSFPTCENIKYFGECPMKGKGACKERILFGTNGNGGK